MNATHEAWKGREALSAAEIIERAAAIIEQRGKTNSGYSDCLGRVCVVGALAAARNMSVYVYHSMVSPEASAVRKFIPGGMITRWSDGTAADVVISTLRACAAIERAKQSPAQPVAVCAELES